MNYTYAHFIYVMSSFPFLTVIREHSKYRSKNGKIAVIKVAKTHSLGNEIER